ncbi:hypothetical protein F4860DRAFT_172870 [Xylaria cubensis]|nr:hypothetical protein F4860DRAFT_172870 [Xylaria cubensis]
MSLSESLDTVAGLCSKVVTHLRHVEVDEHSSEDPMSDRLRLGVLRLRLCRLHDRIAKAIRTDTASFGEQLKSICLWLEKSGAQATGTPSPSNWMVGALDFLSQKHHTRDWDDTERKILNPKALDSLVAQVGKVTEELEAHVSRQEPDVIQDLDRMRLEDANYINGQSQANQKDLHLLEDSAKQVDPDFAGLVALRKGHSFIDTTIDETGKAVVGDEIAADWGGKVVSKSHLYQRTTVRGKVVVGNRLGGESIFAAARAGD